MVCHFESKIVTSIEKVETLILKNNSFDGGKNWQNHTLCYAYPSFYTNWKAYH